MTANEDGPQIATAQEARDVETWLASGKYLPTCMRDFHDQKDLFKTIQELVENRLKTDPSHDCRDMSWRTAHVYTVDFFLWFMAKHGYTLQRAPKKRTYADLHERVESAMRRWRAAVSIALSGDKREGQSNV